MIKNGNVPTNVGADFVVVHIESDIYCGQADGCFQDLTTNCVEIELDSLASSRGLNHSLKVEKFVSHTIEKCSRGNGEGPHFLSDKKEELGSFFLEH